LGEIRQKMTASKIFLYFCLSFVAGIFLNSYLLTISPSSKNILLLLGLILGIILISVFWPFGELRAKNSESQIRTSSGKKNIVIVGFSLLFLVSGIWWHQQVELRVINDELRKYNDLNEKITLIGTVIKEPNLRERNIKLKIKNEKLKINNEWKEIEGMVLVTTSRYPKYQYGDKLKISGKLKTPPVFEGFNYKDFLKKDKIYSVMNWPKIELVGQGFGNPVMSTLFFFKNKFKETTREFISPPQGGILEALVFGDEENISEQWKEKLNLTGTRHITAVSGMNITIIGFLIISFALLLGFWRKQALFLAIFLLALYILMIGAPPSAVRAGIMGGILIIAQYLGKLSSASRAISFAATFMLIQNPLLLKLDIGFQLSFLATMGIIYLQPIFHTWFKKIPDPKIFPLRMTLATTLSAQIFTLPILIYNFGYLPLTSPVANVLIVPFLAPFTILFFIFGISGIIFSPLGYIFSLPAWLCLTYIIGIVDFFFQIPWTSLRIENLHWIFLVLSYLILIFLTWQLRESQRLRFLKY